MMFLDWDQHTANEFPHRVVILSRWMLDYDEQEQEIEKRKKWLMDNITKPIMLANGGYMLCFSCEVDAMAFKLRWI